MNYLKNSDDVSFCYKDACINAFGKNGKLTTAGVFVVLLSITLYNLSKIK
jgi:hypothetical protein